MKGTNIKSSHKFEIFGTHILHFIKLGDEKYLQLS